METIDGAQVPLCAAACFPAFDDLLTLTRWTPDGDERHETLLASGRCQDQAQCAINRSPSPHREHYQNMSRQRTRAPATVTVQIVKTGITPQLATSDRFRE